MSDPIRSLQQSVQQLFGVLPAFTALLDLKVDLGEPARVTIGGDAPSVQHGTIRFEHVTFYYPGAGTPVFTGLNLAIGEGDMVGLSGASGAGKISFVDLLTGLLEPTEGRITIGEGEDAQELGPTMLAWLAASSRLCRAEFLPHQRQYPPQSDLEKRRAPRSGPLA